jgi:GT2 family glycosyltransferase
VRKRNKLRTANLAIVIVNWKRYDLLQQLLAGLQEHTADVSYDIFIAENEAPQSAQIRQQRYGSITTVTTLPITDNLGYAGAINHVLRSVSSVGYSHYLVLNNDLRPVNDFITPLLEALQNPNLAFVSPVTLTPNGTIESCGVDVNPASPYVVHHRQAISQPRNPSAVDSVHGAAIGFTSHTLARVGYLDEEYFHFWDETDWCMRARSLGLTNCVIGQSTIIHLGSQTLSWAGVAYNPIQEYMLMRNMLYFLQKRGYSPALIDSHIDYWRENYARTTFREHDWRPPNPIWAKAVLSRSVRDFQAGVTGIWPASLLASHSDNSEHEV